METIPFKQFLAPLGRLPRETQIIVGENPNHQRNADVPVSTKVETPQNQNQELEERIFW